MSVKHVEQDDSTTRRRLGFADFLRESGWSGEKIDAWWALSTNERMEWLRKDISALRAENAKLRELAKLMHGVIRDLQMAFDASVVVGGIELSAEYFEREYMRELGIEVEL